MISVEEALEKVLSHVSVLEEEPKPILDCLGQVLAEDIYSNINVPPLDNAAMDGYAVRAVDTRGASEQFPQSLHVIETVPAGSLAKREVEPRMATRIMTGAPIPKGADSVVPFEDTDETLRKGALSEIGICREAKAGWNIRQAGEDISAGTKVLSHGTVVRPAEVGVLASLGCRVVRVIRRPVVAILATGDEVVDINQPLPLGKIYNSNSYGIASLVLGYGGIPKLLGIAQDSEESVVAKLHGGLEADMLITTGGVSAGDYDMVKNVLAKEGEIAFWTVRMKPGKPLAFGTIRVINKDGKVRSIPHLGMPGNPVSSMVTFELFARPAILKMLGKKDFTKPTVGAVLGDTIVNNDGRRVFARAIVEKRQGQYFARLTGPQGSGILTSMSLANGLVIVPEDKREARAGEVVQVMMLDWRAEI